jgi:ABC-2 type transport system ATP-binding protein
MALLKALRAEGKAIFMSTHDIFRAREHADRVGIMREGRLLAVRTKEELGREDLHRLYLESMEAA